MSSPANLRLRRSAAQLTALAGVEREIRAQDSHGRRKYLREFSQAFRSYDSLLDSQQIQNALHSADVVLIGDYHALPAAQRYAASLIEQRALAGDRPVVLGVETIFARDQHILDEWWRREVDESELRQRIRFDLDWGYDWTPFHELLVTARDHAEAVYGLSESPISLPDIFPARCTSNCPAQRFSPCCRTLTLFTGAPLVSAPTGLRRSASMMTSYAFSIPHRSKNMRAIVFVWISGAGATRDPTSLPPSTT
jgi:hypothetical protein